MAEVQEPIPKRSDVAKGIRTVYLNRVAHMGMMLDRVQRAQARAERLQDFAASGDTGTLEAPAEEQDMGVNIGNEYHYHVLTDTTPEPAPPTEVTPPAVEPATEPPLWEAGPQTKPLNWWQKGLIGAGALGSGIGLAAIANEYYYGRPRPPAVIDTDTDSITEIDFKESTSVETRE